VFVDFGVDPNVVFPPGMSRPLVEMITTKSLSPGCDESRNTTRSYPGVDPLPGAGHEGKVVAGVVDPGDRLEDAK
jgi:hypothetical protein